MTQRIPDWTVEALTPAQRKVHDAIVSGPRGKVEGPLRVWLKSPELAQRAQLLGEFCRFGTSLPPRLSELAILVVGAHWRAGFEWHAHAPIAIKAGLSPDIVAAIKERRVPSFAKPDEAAVHRFARELLDSHAISDAAYAGVAAHLGETGAVELVGILGYYTLIAMTIVGFGVPVPEGSPEPFGTI